jgi:hypothetical protein
MVNICTTYYNIINWFCPHGTFDVLCVVLSSPLLHLSCNNMAYGVITVAKDFMISWRFRATCWYPCNKLPGVTFHRQPTTIRTLLNIQQLGWSWHSRYFMFSCRTGHQLTSQRFTEVFPPLVFPNELTDNTIISFGWSSQEDWDGQGMWHEWGKVEVHTVF